VFVEVADTGIGIPPDYQGRVFERFFQVDGTKQRRFGGTGLGLALVKELVESYGGHVSVASAGANQGSTFSVVLPTAGG
jgi:signal transduction histidine kinase